ncbi:uncharacterized protein LOC133131144 isoform X3 [Conger conger]|uniref:uncharacterized protein LOC133131144 isoform X3 n=1 Tax=Conger conger TaxID=82655 RepID=UPI002A5A3C98|nr:uncharacterized protein LOC133131144 isoform X3 [Conger conger]
MKPAEAACCLLLITLQLGHTGSTVNPARAGESEELDALLKKFLEVKDEVVRREMKVILKALLRVFSHCTGESASPDDNQGKEKSQESPKSDRKFLWIVLGVLAAIMLVTILILKSKVLICVRVHTKADIPFIFTDVADYMEEKMYSKNDDIVLLGVTPGPEWEEECYFTAKGCDGPMSQCAQQGSPGCEVISPRSTY